MSSLQRARRKLLRPHTFPSSASTAWQRLDSCCQEELAHLSHALSLAATNKTAINIKPVLSAACANIFNAYFCTIPRRDYEDPVLVHYCNDFDDVGVGLVPCLPAPSFCFFISSHCSLSCFLYLRFNFKLHNFTY